MTLEEARKKLSEAGQEHLLQYYDTIYCTIFPKKHKYQM